MNDKIPLDLRQREFIGVVIPDPNKNNNGNFLSNLLSAASTLTGSFFPGGLLSGSNLLSTAISLGLSSVSGGAFLSFGSALTGLTANTPELTGLVNSFNSLVNMSNSFSGLNSYSIGYDTSILRSVGVLGDFAGRVGSIVANKFVEDIVNNVGLTSQDIDIAKEILNNANDVVYNSNSILQSFTGFGEVDIGQFKNFGTNGSKTEQNGNIKNYIHIPELMYQIEQTKGLWCFNRLSTLQKNSSSNASGALGSIASNVAGNAASYFAGPIVGSVAGSIVGGLFGNKKGSGSSGTYVPLLPGSKVFVRFTENDFNAGEIVGIAHQEVDSQAEAAPDRTSNNLSITSQSQFSTTALTNNASDLISSIGKTQDVLNEIELDLSMVNTFTNSIQSSADLISNIVQNPFNFNSFYDATREFEDGIAFLLEKYRENAPSEQ